MNPVKEGHAIGKEDVVYHIPALHAVVETTSALALFTVPVLSTVVSERPVET